MASNIKYMFHSIYLTRLYVFICVTRIALILKLLGKNKNKGLPVRSSLFGHAYHEMWVDSDL